MATTEKVTKRITEECAQAIRAAILEASGNEVFFIGKLRCGVVEEVTVAARGNDYSVPALTHMAEPGGVVIHNHPGGDLTPSDADLSIASMLAENNVAFFITDNDASEIYAVTEPFSEVEYSTLDTEEVTELLGAKGTVSDVLKTYEARDEQIAMTRAVTTAFNENKLLTVEAGTGVGKSLAYLVPSILWAVRNNERVVIATKTINLQEQLIKKDIPLLEAALGVPFKAVLVKGRANYICLRKAAGAKKETTLPGILDEEEEESAAIIEWSERTRDGSLSDLGFTPRGSLWERFASESDTCLRLKCAHYRDCFFNRSRQEMASSDLLVANHHLLFSDAAIKEAKGTFSEAAVLPPFSRLVIDEAHSMEETATDHFGVHITGAGISKQLGRLRSRKGARKGILVRLSKKIKELGLSLNTLTDAIDNDLIGLTESCHGLTRDTFQTLFHFFHSRATSDDTVVRLRIGAAIRTDEDFADLTSEVREYCANIKKLSAEIRLLLKKLTDEIRGNEAAEKDLLALTIEVRAVGSRIADMASALEDILFAQSPEAVRWVQVEAAAPDNPGRPARVSLRLSPLCVAPRIKEALFDNIKTAIMTSATLSVKRSFDFFKGRSGLSLVGDERQAELLLDSPFDYASNVELELRDEVAEPTSKKFASELARILPEIIKDGEGATLVLFTSYALLSRLHKETKREIEALGYNVMRQGDGPRHRLLERFRSDISSVLFGTDSFWEGVDVPGDALKTVVITRLPFEVPNDPVGMARQEEIERRGGNSFRQYSLPNAIIRFRQGFGRLVRRKTDTGRVVVLDSRITKKSYGKSFLNSLPKCRIKARA